MLELELPALVDAPLDTFEVEGEPPVVSGTESVPELVPECGETVTVGVVVMVSAVPLPFVEQATSSAKQLDTTQAAELRRAVRRVRLEVTQ